MSRALQLAAVLAVLASPATAQQRPLNTDDADLLPVGRVRAQFGVEFQQKARFPITGLEGDLTRLGILAVHVGVGEYSEFQISGVARDFLSVTNRHPALSPPSFSGNSTSDFGDIALGTKLKLAPEKGARPAFSFKFAVELPNANRASGLGIDETRFHAALLATKQAGRARILGSLGFAILPSPVVSGKQADPLEFGLGLVLRVGAKMSLVGEVEGRQGPHRVGYENQARVRAGIRVEAGGIQWDVAGITGLREFDAETGLTIGARWEFQGFGRPKRPTTVK